MDVKFKRKILAWTRMRTRVSSSRRWRHSDESLDQAKAFFLVDPHEHLCWHYFNFEFYVNDT